MRRIARKGRGRTYGDSVLTNARKLWEAVECPCMTCFVAELPRIVNRPILDAIECKSGEETMACDVRPGDTQIDAVTHFGELRLDCRDLEADLKRPGAAPPCEACPHCRPHCRPSRTSTTR